MHSVESFSQVRFGCFGICIERENSTCLLVSPTTAHAYRGYSPSPARFRLFQSKHCSAPSWKARGFGACLEKNDRGIRAWTRSKSWNLTVFLTYGPFSCTSIPILFSFVFYNANNLFDRMHLRPNSSQLLCCGVWLDCFAYLLDWDYKIMEDEAILKLQHCVLKRRLKRRYFGYLLWRRTPWRKS